MARLILGAPTVRFVDTTTACVWMQLSAPAAVVLSVKPLLAARGRRRSKPVEHVVWSVRVGGRFYALSYVTGLKPATWYTYGIEVADLTGDSPRRYPTTPDRVRCYKTYQQENLSGVAIGAGPVLRTLARKGAEVLRLAFGSCHKLGGGQREKKGNDAFRAFGRWLKETESDRLTRWPHFLLLVGDQIYGDDVSPNMMGIINPRRKAGVEAPISLARVELSAHRRAGVQMSQLIAYEEFATLYDAAWADHDAQVALANVPTFMMIDDHEVTDDWNITGMWLKQMQDEADWMGVIVDAVAAYWVYQGWGNLHPEHSKDDQRVKLLNEHAAKGTEALPDLQRLLRQTLYADPKDRLPWSYRIDSSPPIFAVDDRADRELLLPSSTNPDYASPEERIASRHQLAQLDAAIVELDEPLILATSLPVVHPQPLRNALFLVNRPLLDLIKAYEVGYADDWEDLRRAEDMEGWYGYPRSVDDLSQLFESMRGRGQKGPVVVLSGDIHFAYATWGRFPPTKLKEGHPLLQLVSSPLFNALTDPNRKKLKEIMEEGFPTPIGRFPFATINPFIAERKDRKLIPGFDDLAALVEQFLETAASAVGAGAYPKDFVGPHFTKVENQPAGSPEVVEDEILFENNMCFVEISRNRKMLEARWLIPDPAKKKALAPACSVRKSLAGI